MLFSTFIISLSLSIDALGIGLSFGLRNIKIPFTARTVSACLCFFITSLSLIAGEVIKNVLDTQLMVYFSSALLIFLGCMIILKALKKESPEKETPLEKTFFIKSLGLTVNIISAPATCDIDGSNTIDIKEALYLGCALSMDSLAVGISYAIGSKTTFLIPVFSAISQFIFLYAGSMIGSRIKMPHKENFFSVMSGVIIAVLGIVKLM